MNLHENRMQAELGITLASEQQGYGYATEAMRAVLRDLFERRGLHRLSAECDARNLDSARLLERVGFQNEGRRPANTWIKGEWTDDLLFGLLADRWSQLTAAAGPVSPAPSPASRTDGDVRPAEIETGGRTRACAPLQPDE